MSALGEAGADLRSPPARGRGGEGAAGAERQASDSLSPTPSPERGGANAADYVETPARRAWRRLVRRRGAMVGLAVIILVIIATLTMSYLLRRPSNSGDGVTERERAGAPASSA